MNDPAITTTLQLVQAAQKGSRQAMEDLFRRYLPRVPQIVALRMGRRLRDVVELDDIAQEVLVRVFRGLDRFEHRSEGSFRNWLCRCVECAIVDEQRAHGAVKRGRGQVKRFADVGGEGLVATLFPGRGRGPSTIAAARELEAQVEEALLGLPDHYRELVILRHLCDVSYEEIAEIMKFTTAETARRACNRALAKLREIVQPKVCPPE